MTDILITEVESKDNNPEVELKKCQKCHQEYPKEEFYKRQDRNGEYKWKTSYCKKCSYERMRDDRLKHADKYKLYYKEYTNKYYHENKDKVKIIQKRYYYNKLPPEKQVRYKKKVEETWPEWAELICGK
jgi:hypothetical protein